MQGKFWPEAMCTAYCPSPELVFTEFARSFVTDFSYHPNVGAMILLS